MPTLARTLAGILACAWLSAAVVLPASAETNPNRLSPSRPGQIPQTQPEFQATVRYPDCPTFQFDMVEKTPSVVRCRIQYFGNWGMVYENVAKTTPCAPSNYWTGPTVWRSNGYVHWKCEHGG